MALYSPRIVESDQKFMKIFYESELIFEGLESQISIDFRPRSRFTSFEVFTLNSSLNARQEFRRVYEHLAQVFGETKIDLALGELPYASWQTKFYSLQYFVFERFGEYCVLNFQRKRIASQSTK